MRRILAFLAFLVLTSANLSETLEIKGRFNSYLNHQCIRDCLLDETPRTCEYDWTLEFYSTASRACHNCPQNHTDCEREHCIFADGLKKSIEVVNRLFPGPSIQVCRGDTIVVRLTNSVRSARVTSIHWHGLKQFMEPYMDGVGMVTQYPILPHTSFVYRFVARDVGTHFWHSHSGVQRGDGVFGALIVRQPKQSDPNGHLYDFDLKEHYITVIEWTKNSFQSDYGAYLHAAHFLMQHTILINGKGALSDWPETLVPLETYIVRPGYRYRFRFIHAGVQDCAMSISIDEHNLTVIASDGAPLESVQVESLMAYTGERYDFVVVAAKDTDLRGRDYWIKVRGEGECNLKNMSQRAILRYERPPITSDENEFDDHETSGVLKSNDKWTYEDSFRSGLQLRTFKPSLSSNTPVILLDKLKYGDSDKDAYFEKISRKPDKKFYLNMDIMALNDPEFHHPELYSFDESQNNIKPSNTWRSSLVNNIKFTMPDSPPLLTWETMNKSKICSNSISDDEICTNKDFCECIHVIEVGLNDLVEIFFIDGSSFYQEHPTHLHGHNFAVVGVDRIENIIEWNNTKTVTNELIKDLDEKGLLKRNFNRPPIKDNIAVPSHGYAIIRFIADNPGFWLLHCHLDSHSENGMTVLIRVGETKDLPPKPKDLSQNYCLH